MPSNYYRIGLHIKDQMRKMIKKPIDLFFIEQGEGIPVLLIHGYPLDHQIWSRVVSMLAKKARIITPDLRGFGLSSATKGTYSMSLFAMDIIHLLDQLKIEKAIFVGHSMGGYVCLEIARSYSERMAGLALVASQAEADSSETRVGRYASIKAVEKKEFQSWHARCHPDLQTEKTFNHISKQLITRSPEELLDR